MHLLTARRAEGPAPHSLRRVPERGGPHRPPPPTGCLQTCTVRSLGDPLRSADGDPHPRPRPVTEVTYLTTHQFSSAQSLTRVQLCDTMNCSTPGLPVHHQLLEFTQTHVHRVGDAIQPSHPLLSPSPPAPIPPSIRVFSNESTLCMRWPKYWSFSFSIIPSKEHPELIS